MLPQKFLKIGIYEMAISSILSQISYSFNTIFLLLNFAFVKKTPKKEEGGGWGHRPPGPLDLSLHCSHLWQYTDLLCLKFLWCHSYT